MSKAPGDLYFRIINYIDHLAVFKTVNQFEWFILPQIMCEVLISTGNAI
jgi:hypothetical protein